jgi:hypothetical protein
MRTFYSSEANDFVFVLDLTYWVLPLGISWNSVEITVSFLCFAVTYYRED